MERHFVITKTSRDQLLQWISEVAKHRTYEEVRNVLQMLTTLPEAELPIEPDTLANKQTGS